MDLTKYFERLNTNELLTFIKLQKFQDLHLDDDDFSILRNKKITGNSFLTSKRKHHEASGLTVYRAIEINNLKKKVISSKYGSIFFIKYRINNVQY
jgi:hypothetical protein